jgi:WD40 repeat protein
MTEIEGRPVVVSGSWDQSVRVWDLERGELFREPLYGISPVKNMDVVQLNGLPVVVCGGADQTVWLWDLSSGSRIGQPLTDYKDRDVWEWENWREMGAVAALQLGQRILIVTGNADATLRVWEFDSKSFSLEMTIEVGTQIYAIVPFHSGIVVCGEMGLMAVQLLVE